MVLAIHFFPLWLAATVSFCIPGFSSAAPRVNSSLSNDSVFQIGEELTYNVRYALIDLGQVRIRIVGKIAHQDVIVYKAVAHIDSYTGVPFVDLHALYESHIDASVYSHWFHSRAKGDSKLPHATYEFNYPRQEVVILQGSDEARMHQRSDTISLDGFTQDGLSLFYFARTQLFSRKTMHVPTIVSEKKGETEIRFVEDRVGEKIDAVDYPIDLVHFEGNADFVGIFGLTGDFEGWFSNDAARVPVLANMKVVIGEIHIELVKWKRPGWIPPRFEEAKVR